MKPIRNRIIEHVQVRAADLVPHPFNWRRHSDEQRQALTASYEEVGFARSLLGYRLPDGKIQLIDGHLRRDLEPEMLVTVEVLDVNDEEARKLLLTIDPLAALATSDAEALARLAEITRADSALLNDLWQSLAGKGSDREPALDQKLPEQFLIMVECRDEAHQVELLAKFEAEGLRCKALIS
jgi:ParB-like chromosome segregation protein Spo0J